MSDPIILGNFEAVHELTENDNFHTSIYESDYTGLLIARCNQNGKYPHQAMAILNGLNGKQASADLVAQYASRISQQDAELERLRHHVELLQEKDASQCGCSIDRPDDVCLFHVRMKAEARKAAFIEAAEMAQNITSAECREIISEEKWVDMTDDYGEHIGQMKQGACFRLNFRKGIAAALRAKAEETGR